MHATAATIEDNNTSALGNSGNCKYFPVSTCGKKALNHRTLYVFPIFEYKSNSVLTIIDNGIILVSQYLQNFCD